MAFLPVPAVFPVLPVVAGWLLALLGGLVSLVFAALTLRRDGWRTLGRVGWRLAPGLVVWGLLWGLGAWGWRWVRARGGDEVVVEGGAAADPWTLAARFRRSEWPELRGSPDRRGLADQVPGPTRGGVVWGRASDHRFDGTPSIVGDTVLAVGARDGKSRLFGWRVTTGELLFSTSPDAFQPGFSSPVVDELFLAVGEGLHTTTDARLLLFRRPTAGPPELVQTLATQGHIEGTPILAGGRLWFTAGSEGVYCYSLDFHRSPPAELQWRKVGPAYPDAETALAYSQGHLYVGLGKPGPAIVQLNAVTGQEQRRVVLSQPCHCPPAVRWGRLYVGTGEAVYGEPAAGTTGELICLDSESLQVLWRVTTPASLLGAIVAADDGVICTTVAGETLVYDLEGNLRQSLPANVPVWTAPAVTDRWIYVVDSDGRLTGWDRRTGEPAWRVTLGPPGYYTSSPVVARGHVLVGTPESGLVCVGPGPDGLEESAARLEWPGRLPATGEVAWRARAPAEWPAELAPSSPVQRAGDAWFVVGKPRANEGEEPAEGRVAAGGEEGGAGLSRGGSSLVCLDGGGDVTPQVRWKWEALGQIRPPVAIGPERVAVLVALEGAPDTLAVLDRESGVVQGTADLHREQGIPLVADREGVYGADAKGVWHRDWNLTAVWGGVDLGVLRSWAAWGDLLVAVSDSPPRLVALDRRLGETVWRVELEEPVTGPRGEPLVMVNDEVWLEHVTGVRGYSLLSGGELWRADWPGGESSRHAERAWTGRRLWLRDGAGTVWTLGADSNRAGSKPEWTQAEGWGPREGAGRFWPLFPGGAEPGGMAWREGLDWWGWWEDAARAAAGDSTAGDSNGSDSQAGESREGVGGRRLPFRLGEASRDWPPVATRRGVLLWRAEGLVELRPEELRSEELRREELRRGESRP